jgi:hypothetical protein
VSALPIDREVEIRLETETKCPTITTAITILLVMRKRYNRLFIDTVNEVPPLLLQQPGQMDPPRIILMRFTTRKCIEDPFPTTISINKYYSVENNRNIAILMATIIMISLRYE